MYYQSNQQLNEDYSSYVGDPLNQTPNSMIPGYYNHYDSHCYQPYTPYFNTNAANNNNDSFIESSYSILYDSDMNSNTSPTSSCTSTYTSNSSAQSYIGSSSTSPSGYYSSSSFSGTSSYELNSSLHSHYYYATTPYDGDFNQVVSPKMLNYNDPLLANNANDDNHEDESTSKEINSSNCYLITEDVKFDIKNMTKENDILSSAINSPIRQNLMISTSNLNGISFAANNKPTESYLEMIAKAIISSNENRMQLKDIYNYITNHYSYYAHHSNPKRWKNSIRHNLSRHACFVKSGKDAQGHFWHIHSSCLKLFKMGIFNGKALNDAFKLKSSKNENYVKSSTHTKRYSPY